MAAPAHYYKLGVFMIIAAIAVVATVLLFAGVSLERSVKYHTFFDESVQGLELGAPVKLRGVTVGHVSHIAIAPDHEHVDVVSELDADGSQQISSSVSPRLRAQLATQGITGVKFMSLDVFDPRTHPAPALPFPTPDHTIPATPSTLKNLEDLATQALERLPEVMEAVLAITARVDRMLATLERNDVGAEAVTTLRRADEVLRTLQTTFARLDRENLGTKAAGTLDELHGAAMKLNAVLDRLGPTQTDLEGTLRDVSDAADAIRSLATAVERDPDMLLKGKSGPKGRR
jgi:phospholipid/cholesterol/gamma-HCH transport system substrate-binding protein